MIKTLQPLNWYRYCLPNKEKQNDLHSTNIFSDQIKYVYINKGSNNHNFNDKDLSEKKKKNIHTHLLEFLVSVQTCANDITSTTLSLFKSLQLKCRARGSL